jgi:hypothetical protein
MSQTATHSETITSMDESRQHDEDDLTWSRFWLGIACVIAFVIASILLVIAIGGTRAGADYGLLALIVTLLAGLVDGIVLSRRRNR